MLLGHINGDAARLIKATSQTWRYDNDAALMDGVVCYEEGTCDYFRRKTVIQPENCFTIRHYQLNVYATQGRLEVVGPMPSDFEGRLERAIRGSKVIDKRRWIELAAVLPWLGESPH